MSGRARGRGAARMRNPAAPGSDGQTPATAAPSGGPAPRGAPPGIGASASRPATAPPTAGAPVAWAAPASAPPGVAGSGMNPRPAGRGRAMAARSAQAKPQGSAGVANPTPTGGTSGNVWGTKPSGPVATSSFFGAKDNRMTQGAGDSAIPSNGTDGGGRGASRGDNKPAVKPTGGISMPTGDLEKLSLGGGDRGKQGDMGNRRMQHYYNPHTRPPHITDKKGFTGKSLTLTTNFFKLQYKSDYVLHQYHVDYDPPIDSKMLRKGLFHEHGERLLRVYTFDGMIVFSPTKIHEEKTEVISVRKHDGAKIRLIITRGQEIPKYSATLIQTFNMLMRQTLSSMGLEEVDRNYFSKELAIRLVDHGLEIWPGYNTSILQYEEDILLNMNLKHKVMRLATAYDIMERLHSQASSQAHFRDSVHKALIGKTVLTMYNEKQYRIHDVDWNLSPQNTFERKLRDGTINVTYADYFRESYQKEIKHMRQPLLVHKLRKGDGEKLIHLLPELCKMTELTDEMRTDFRLMKDMGEHTRVNPAERARQMKEFRGNMDRAPRQPLRDFQLEVAPDLLEIPGRLLPDEAVQYSQDGRGNIKTVQAGPHADWTNALKNGQVTCMTVSNWYMIFSRNHQRNAEKLRDMMFEVAQAMGIQFAKPEMIAVDGARSTSFVQAMHMLKDSKNRFTLVLMPSNKSDFYSAIKKEACVVAPHVNQCVTNFRVNKPAGLRSVVTKIVIQINCKLGGEAWRVKMPIAGTMITGMDTYHDAGKNQSVAGFVATLTSNATRYYSFTNHQANRQEVMPQMQQKIIASLKMWHSINGSLPKRVIAYRDGVGEGQLEVVRDMEVRQYLDAFSTISKGEAGMWDPATQGQYTPEFAFIVVTKRINPRFFANEKGKPLSNPGPGTVVDQVVTRMESYDFYLISQSVRQGTVSPAHYNIIKDSTSYKPDIMQRLTYKLCHLYYNWPGTIRVPAPCQYAHKLAYLTGTALHQTHSPHLNQFLFYL